MTARLHDGARDRDEFGPARADDLDVIVSIDLDSPQAWTRDAFLAELAHDPPTLFVLRSSARVVAFAVARIHVPEMDIVSLAVAPEFRRRGWGRFLLRSLLERMSLSGVQTVFLEVREGNQEARGLYLGAGFMETQRRRGFYAGPVEDAILMRLEMRHERG